MGDSGEGGEETVVEFVDGAPPRLESQLALARARERLLGRSSAPTRMGRYEIAERLGSGGMGIVYAARDPDLDRVVAVKVLRSRLVPDSQGRGRLVREAQALAKLSHPNVVHVYEVGREDDQVFIAMEFVQGRTLSRWVHEEKPEFEAILGKYADAGRGLLAAHSAGVIHRDFKPDNVLVGDDGRVRVMDFGLARPSMDADTLTEMVAPEGAIDGERTPESMTRTGMVMGTPAYMDPQQLVGETADASSDQYSFCVSLYESLFGQRPFVGSTVTELFRSMRRRKEERLTFPSRAIPRPVLDLLRRGLSYERADRFPSFEALLTALDEARSPTPSRWRRWAVPLVGVAAIGGLGFAMQAGRDDGPSQRSQAPAEVDPRAAIVAETDLPAPVETPLPDDPMHATVHRLDNGLTVYVVPRPQDPTVRVQVVVRAGPSEEPEGASGVADWLTAVVSEGSANLGVRESEAEAPLLAAQHEALLALGQAKGPEERAALLQKAQDAHRESLSKLGTHDVDYVAKEFGVVDATMNVELGSTFASELPASALEGWLALQAELVTRPAFRGAVLQAAHVLESLPWRFTHSFTYQTIMGRTARAYGRWRDLDADYASVQQTPFAALLAFHDTYYRPNNTAIVLVGNVTADSVLPLVERTFGAWAPAEIPAPAILRDEPLPDAGALFDVQAPARHAVWVGFTLPPANDGSRPKIEALTSILTGPHGLYEGATADHPLFEHPWVMLEARTLTLVAVPREGVSAQQVHEAILETLRRVAEGEVDAESWELAAARWPLDAAWWDRSRADLTRRISDAYLLHREWDDVVQGHSGASLPRAQIEQVAASILARDHVAMHVEPGPAWTPKGPEGLPVDTSFEPSEVSAEPSDFAKAIADTPRPVVEPQFLTEGMHFRTTAWGDAKVVTHQAEGSLFSVDLVFPVGVREDPLLCDAVRMRADRWQESVAMAQLDLDVWCEADSTTIALTGVASTFEATWAELWERIDETTLPEDFVRTQVEAIIRDRNHARKVPSRLLLGAGELAMGGPARYMPSDAALRSVTASRIEESLARLASTTPDIAYAGPEPQRLRANLPAPRGPRTEAAAPEVPTEHTFYVVDFPEVERAEAQFFVDWVRGSPREALLADVHFAQPGPAFEHTIGKDVTAYLSPIDGVNGVIPVDYAWGFEADHRDFTDLLVLAVDDYTDGPDPKWYERARADVETSYRNDRYARIEIPRYVLTWTDPIDPRLGRWSELGRLTPEVFADYAKQQGTRPLGIALVCDLSRVDLRALEKVGRVVVVSREDAVRNTRERIQQRL